ncbi:MAG: EAL domain-containing protein [Lachnospiraceae bacterium]|nr:EAL domain-containing protein [Lachnospiraceae bacterium]
MASKSEKKYRKIKRTHIGVSIIEFVLFAVIAAAMISLTFFRFTSYIVNTKLDSEYESIRRTALLYEKAVSDDDDDLFEYIKGEGRAFIVTGPDGSIVDSFGENTCSDKGSSIFISSAGERITAYADTEKDFIYPLENGGIGISYTRFHEWINSDIEPGNEHIEHVMNNARYLELPLWVSVDIADGDMHFTARASAIANRTDVLIIITAVGAIAVFVAFILITMLVSAIRNVVRQRRMLDLFFKDIVTEGHNWTWFLVMGERELKKSVNSRHKYAVVNFVLMNYRNYCVCHSLKEGEKLLCRIYRSINASLKRGEKCAHTTSSNFALLLKYDNEQELAKRLQDLIGRLEKIDDDHRFAFQAGISLIDRAVDGNGAAVSRKNIDIDTEYNNASMARNSLGDSDDSGVVFFDDRLKEEQKWLDAVQERQQRAVDNGEFLVYYQPKYDPKTNVIKGAEALIRWDSPEFGLVPPGKFIPIFEKNGFITTIDHYMLRHVAADQKRWLDLGYKCVPVSVNVSRAHFIENDLAEQVRDMVDAAGTPHELIEIELTESAFFDDKKALLNTINRLKNYGFAVSMDDFGSGYSSLNSLKDMPLDVLKLDAEFFRGESEGGRGETVVSEAIRLGKLLDMKIVAEGVEVKEQVDFLAGEDCDMIQGFYFAKPMPVNEFEDKIKPDLAASGTGAAAGEMPGQEEVTDG